LFHPALEALFGIMTNLDQQLSILKPLDGFIPSSSEKAAIFLLVEVVPGLQ
jgi:hypothetical protein